MGGLACIMGALATPHGASAQTLAPENPGSAGLLNEPGVTVASRERPDYARLGVRLGSAIIRPEVSQAYGYDDNVTATPKAHGSPVVQTSINLRAGTDLSRYGVTAGLTVDDLRYLDLPKQSATNWTVALGGAYQPGRDTVSLDYLHVNQNQTPRDLNTPLLDQALAYRVDSLTAGYGVAFSRLLLRPELSVSRYDFDDGTAAGQPFTQRFRNRIAVMPSICMASANARTRTCARSSTSPASRTTAAVSCAPISRKLRPAKVILRRFESRVRSSATRS